MRGTTVIRDFPRSRARMAGLSIIELMIAIALGLIVLAGLATLFANQSAARAEMERSSRQIENGRFAMELLGDDLRMAGFYGELNVTAANFPAPGALVDPCSFNQPDWIAAIAHHVQGYDEGAGAPGCVPADLRPNTDIVVIRRVSTCEADTANCSPSAAGKPYIQVARCAAEVALSVAPNAFELGLKGTAPFQRHQRDCAGIASLRQYFVRIYYVADVPVAGKDPLPVLTRLDFNDTTNQWAVSPMVEGIEQLQLEYGLDTDGDGDPDAYAADPTTYACAGCTGPSNWANVVTVRMHVLARNTEESVNYTDTKEYVLGRTAAGVPNKFAVAPGTQQKYRRHAYSGLVRIVNAAARRDTP